MPASRDILICGAGIAGPALALCLVRHGFAPILIERAPRFRDGGYMIDVWGIGYDLVERLGLLGAARARGYAFDRLAFVDATGRAIAGYGGERLRRATGGRFFSIPRGDLALTLHEAIEGQVETLYATSIASLRDSGDGVVVTTADGRTRRFDLVIGADGLRSRVRALAFGPGGERYLGYQAAAFVADAYPHRDEDAYVSYARPGRQVSRYAMRDGRSAFLMVFAAEAPVAADGLAAQKAALRAHFGGDGWETPAILELLAGADELYFDSVSQIRLPAWTRGRVALVGDAAYCPSLLAGAGSAFAMLGAYMLAGELAAADGDPIRAFAAYEARLAGFMARQQCAAARFASAFAPRTALGLALRTWSLRAMAIPGLGDALTRRMFAQAMALPDYEGKVDRPVSNDRG